MPTKPVVAVCCGIRSTRRRRPGATLLRALLSASGVLCGALLSECLLAAEAVPEAMEPAVLVSRVVGNSVGKSGDDPFEPGLDAADGWQLDPTIFAEMEAYAVPITPLALPEDQREE